MLLNSISVCDYLVLRGFLGDSKLEVPLSGGESSSGTVSNSEPSLLIARALRRLFCKEEKNTTYDATYDIPKEGISSVLCHTLQSLC